ncbi:MAG: hypothetical protein AAF281_05790 [Pseudomonadota bacterium]
MMVHIPSRLAFLATPKCASTSVENALRPHCQFIATGFPSMTHMHVNRYNRFVRPLLKATGFPDVKTTCLFREPIDWVGSWWRYRRQDRFSGEESTKTMSFETYAQRYIEGEKLPFLPKGHQAGMFWGPEGRVVLADYIFRYEDLDLYAEFWSRKIGKTVKFGRHNVSPDMAAALSPGVEDALRAYLATDYQIWNEVALRRDGFEDFLKDHFESA